MIIVGLGHRKHTGKSTAARFLANHYRLKHRGSCVISRGFADKVKDICYSLYSWAGMKPTEHYEQNPEEKGEILPLIGKTVRQIWIETGEAMRTVYPATWSDYLIQNNSADLLITPDLRYTREADAIHNRKGFCIKIVRPSIEDTHDSADDDMVNYNKWDKVIVNDGTLKEFHTHIVDAFEELTQ